MPKPNEPKILAFVTKEKDRHLGGSPLALLAKDDEDLFEISEAIAEAFAGYIMHLNNGDCLIVTQ